MRITWLKCCIPGGQLREEASQIISILVHMVFFFLFFASVFIHSSSYDNTILFLLFFHPWPHQKPWLFYQKVGQTFKCQKMLFLPPEVTISLLLCSTRLPRLPRRIAFTLASFSG